MIIFLFLLNITPSFDSYVTVYMTDVLNFNSKELANFNTVGTIFYILGLLMYSFKFWYIEPKKFFLTTNFILWIINCSFMLVVLKVLDYYGINVKLFCYLS